MRPALSLPLLLGIVGLLLVSGEVGAPSGGLGNLATSLCAELIRPNNYNCIEYEAVTDDGFILGIQNIPSRRGGSTQSPAVLLQHGYMAGGDNWVSNPPQQSLGFILADAGFNVWIANTRAVQWSKGHQTLVPSQNAYWAWTYDELASFDLKASTEFVYNKIGRKKFSYIGHSLGTTILFAGLTQGRFNTTVLGYLNAAVLLAPTAILAHVTAPLLVASLVAFSTPATYAAGAQENSNYEALQLVCGLPLLNPALCFATISGSVGPTSYTNQSRLGFYSQYFPQPTSTYNINHRGQGYVRSDRRFAFYDKGTTDNLATYGQATPPNYDLTKFPAHLPVQIWTGGIDAVANPTDVATALGLLPSTNREVHTLPDYGHTDFIVGTNAYIDIYPSLITFLRRYV